MIVREAVPFHVDPRDDKRRVMLHLVPVQGAPRRRAFPWRALAFVIAFVLLAGAGTIIAWAIIP